MVLYGIGLLPLSELLKEEFKDLLQIWYADDAKGTGYFDHISSYFKLLCEEGPKFGYYPEPTKSILITHEKNTKKATEFFSDYGFKITSGARYLGGYIGTPEGIRKHIKDKVKNWERGVKALAEIARSQPHCAFVGLKLSL